MTGQGAVQRSSGRLKRNITVRVALLRLSKIHRVADGRRRITHHFGYFVAFTRSSMTQAQDHLYQQHRPKEQTHIAQNSRVPKIPRPGHAHSHRKNLQGLAGEFRKEESPPEKPNERDKEKNALRTHLHTPDFGLQLWANQKRLARAELTALPVCSSVGTA
jgi:hypothetical protein